MSDLNKIIEDLSKLTVVEAAELSKFCASLASQLPSVDEVILSDDNLISFGECMSDHGYIDQIHRNN